MYARGRRISRRDVETISFPRASFGVTIRALQQVVSYIGNSNAEGA